MHNTTPTIILLGSTGYTGGLIAAMFESLGVKFWAYGRSAEKLQILQETHVHCIGVQVFNSGEDDLQSVLTPQHVVVNCIGPFNLYAKPIVAACIEAGACYIDITGEQSIVQASFDTLSQQAKSNGALIIHSMAFESALSDLLFLRSSKLNPAAEYRSFNTYYLLNSKQMSPGTRITMKVANAYDSVALCDSQYVDLSSLSDGLPTDPIAPMNRIAVGYPEPMLAKAHGNVKNACAHYLIEPNSDMGYFMSQPSPRNRVVDVEGLMARHQRSQIVGPTAEERAQQTFEIHTYLTSDAQITQCVLSGRDMYGLTAELVVFSALKAIRCRFSGAGDVAISGVLTPAQFLSNEGLQWLQMHKDLKLTVNPLNQANR